MNIRIPHTWLLEHLDTKATPQEIQRLLSLSGPSVERIYEEGEEFIYDIEVTTNRVDSMSVRGIAREAAVILSQAGVPATLKPVSEVQLPAPTTEVALPTITSNPALCPRILCQVLEVPKNQQSPDWMQERLKQVEIQPLSLAIDITNYVTHELGHPCHAFDYDRLMAFGGEIIVKRAEAGVPFTTLDNLSYTTVGGEIVFVAKDGTIIDLPGIKGTANTAITNETTRVLFWIESIDPTSVRFASMSHAIRTVAAQLNEKGIDPYLAEDVFTRGIDLFTTLGKGQCLSQRADLFTKPALPQPVTVGGDTITAYLGIQIPATTVSKILQDLGCTVHTKGNTYQVTPPTFRADIAIAADVIEEIARIYGYHNLPSVLMQGAIPTNRPDDTYAVEHDTKQFLSTLGGWELYTYSMISQELAILEAAHLGVTTPTSHVHLANSLLEDMSTMRRTLWASHLEPLSSQQGTQELVVYELANTYTPAGDNALPIEELHLTLTTLSDARTLKGMLEALLATWHAAPVSYRVHQDQVQVWVGETQVGTVFWITYGGKTFSVLDLLWKTLVTTRRTHPTYTPASKYTPIVEDLTFTVPPGVYTQEVLDAIGPLSPLIQGVTFHDVYKQNVTLRITYHSKDKQLTSAEVQPIRAAIIKEIAATFRAPLAGTAT